MLEIIPSLVGLESGGLGGGAGLKIARSHKFSQTDVARCCFWKGLEAKLSENFKEVTRK